MTWQGNGLYARLYDWTDDNDNGINIEPDRMDAEFDGIVAAINDIIQGNRYWTGVIKAANGTAAAPSITFNSDGDTGFFRKSANVVAVAAGGNEVFTFDGNTSGLSIGANGQGDTQLRFYDDSNDQYRDLSWDDSESAWTVEDSTGTTRKMYHEGRTVGADDIPDLPASKIASGTIAPARLPVWNGTQAAYDALASYDADLFYFTTD